MFLDIKSKLQEQPLSELLSHSVFPDEDILNHTIKEYQSNNNFEIYGYLVDDEVIGVLGYQLSDEATIHVRHISVHPDYRGLGYGRGLLMELIEWKKPDQLVVETDEEAVDFYRSVGFTIISLGEQYPGVELFRCTYHTYEN